MIRRKIRNELLKIGYNPIHIGTNYLIEGILILYVSGKEEINLERDIYIELSKKYNKSAKAIKASIRKATDYADSYGSNIKEIETLGTMKLTPKLVIVIILNKLDDENILSIKS